ncbi:MAG: putative RNA dependent RNA polymerase [Inari totivirus 2]|nr:MAG: putative RNA dependent RNA polymerase [Inari totivirus 2]
MYYGVVFCKTCQNLVTQTQKYIELDNGNGCLTEVPLWMSKPHICTLEGMQLVERYYQKLWLHKDLYTKWMAINGQDYQLGDSPVCMSLWRDFEDKAVSIRKVPKTVTEAKQSVLDKSPNGVISFRKCSCRKNGLHVKINWNRIKKKGDLVCLDSVWDYSSEADAKKTTVSASQIIWHARRSQYFKDNFDSLICILGVCANNVTAAALAFHCLGNPSVGKVKELVIKNKICCLESKEYADLFKLLSIALRRSSYWPRGVKATLSEVAHCSGWELAIGRSSNISDWKEEKRKRTKVKMNLKLPDVDKADDKSNDDYCKELEDVLVDLLRPLTMGFTFLESYESFIKNRQSWVSSGSSGGERITVEGESIRINKHVLFEKLTKEEMISWLDSTPRTSATASEKFESGKARAIYGTKAIDYAISAYVLTEIEPRLNLMGGVESGLVGIDVLTSVRKRMTTAMTPGTECSMIDYADFNYQHTLKAQSLVFKALVRLFTEAGAHPDKIKAAEWTAEALLNQCCRFPGDKGDVLIVQGMFSGCRATNFINTTLNNAYFELTRRWVAANMFVRPLDLFNIHQGDDVWITNRSRVWSIVVYHAMQQSGFEFQAKKQMFDECRAEFLRVLYSSEGCMGYLARAIPTLIIKPIQSTDISGPVERAVAMNAQLNLLRRRGFTEEASEIAWHALVPYEARVKLPKGNFSVPVWVMSMLPRNGGLGLAPPGLLASKSNTVRMPPSVQMGSSTLEEVVPTNMSKDWISYISDKIRGNFDAPALLDMVHAANVTDSLRPKDKMECLAELEGLLRAWKDNLVPAGAVVNRSLFEEKILTEGTNSKMEWMLERLLKGELPKHGDEERSLVGIIHLGISLCPFKNISAAAIALKGDWADLVRACLGMCPRPLVQYQAGQAFELMIHTVGVPVTKLLLEDINIGSSYFECVWHPILLSWVVGKAKEQAELVIVGKGITNVEEARNVVHDEFDTAIGVLNRYVDLRNMSRY